MIKSQLSGKSGIVKSMENAKNKNSNNLQNKRTSSIM